MSIDIEISCGEPIDRITIPEIRFARIADTAKSGNAVGEIAMPDDRAPGTVITPHAIARERDELKPANENPWLIENAIRAKEAAQAFDRESTDLARSALRSNNQRAGLQCVVNERPGAALVEENSYQFC